MPPAAPTTIDAYIASLPEASADIVAQLRHRLSAAAPTAVEGIKYGMPTATLGKTNVIYYAAWKTHIGLYPVYRGSPAFETALQPYRDKKDTVGFKLNKPIPYEIIDMILRHQLEVIERTSRVA